MYIYVENNKINGCGEFPNQKEDCSNIEVSKEIYDKFLEDTTYFIFKDGKIIENSQYARLKEEEEIKRQIEEINEKLDLLDTKRIRAVCEDEIRNEKTGETWLEFYNSQIYDLRTLLKSLEAKL